jgi:hypothetical protein
MLGLEETLALAFWYAPKPPDYPDKESTSGCSSQVVVDLVFDEKEVVDRQPDVNQLNNGSHPSTAPRRVEESGFSTTAFCS